MDTYKIKTYLMFLDSLQPGLKVQSFINFPCPWIGIMDEGFDEYVSIYGFPNHREILTNEIVIDVDSEDHESGVKHANLIEKQLIKNKILYKRYKSGGDGQHFHIMVYMPHIEILLSENNLGRIRSELIKAFIGDDNLLRPIDWEENKILSHVCLFNKKLIQIEDMSHRKGGVKTLLSGTGGVNFLTDEIFNRFRKLKEEELKVKKRIKEYNLSIPIPDCIKYFTGETINGCSINQTQDGLYRILFSLVNFHKQRGLSEREINKSIKEWLDSLPQEWVKRSSKKISPEKIKYMIKHTDGSAGCNYRENILDDTKCLNVCNNCPYSIKYLDNKVID